MINSISSYGYGAASPYGGMQAMNGASQGGGRMRALIDQGVQNGTISQQDAQALQAQGQQFRQMKQAAMADGQITEDERNQLRSYRQQMMSMIGGFNQGGGGMEMAGMGGCQCQGGAQNAGFVSAVPQMNPMMQMGMM